MVAKVTYSQDESKNLLDHSTINTKEHPAKANNNAFNVYNSHLL